MKETECYIDGCTETFENMEGVEAHIRATSDYAHDVTQAFLPGAE